MTQKTARILVFALLTMALLSSCAFTPAEQHLGGAPAHHTNKGFKNLYIEEPNKNFFSFLRMRLFGDDPWADHEKTADNVPYRQLDIGKARNPSADQLQVSWLGHSTFLIQYQGINILTDPIFSNRASPFGFAGPKRYTRHVMNYSDLPPIDFVVISHNHYDHLDDTAVELLKNQPMYLVPLRLGEWFTGHGIDENRIHEFDWWDTLSFPAGDSILRIEAQPSQHWSARGLFDRRKTLWASWRLELGDKSLWFAGDTGYNARLFKEIGNRAGPVDLALIPIGAFEPRSFMKTYHVDPDEAVMIHKDVGAKASIGMHWGTYPLTAETPLDPPRRLHAARTREGLTVDEFRTLSLGETLVIKD